MTHSRQFLSDNAAAVHPRVWEAMRAADEADAPYDNDALSLALDEAFGGLFGREAHVLWAATGTAANCLALATMCPPHGGVVCHREAHIEVDEAGAPGFYLHGAKLMLAEGDGAKLTPEAVLAVIGAVRDDVHQVQPHALSVTQASEYGRCYRPDELTALGALVRARGLGFHVDGARFANAVATLKCAPADVAQHAGVDVISLGGTKNGLPLGEAIVFFDRTLAGDFKRRRKQGGQLASKMRFLAAPWLGVLRDGAWLRHAAHANTMATRLAAAIRPLPEIRLIAPVEANGVFVDLPQRAIDSLRALGWQFHVFVGETGVRFMCAWDTTDEAVNALVADLRDAVNGMPRPPTANL